MRALLGSLRKLILGETWSIPLGVGAGLGVALALRASIPGAEWRGVGGFCLAVFVLATLAISLRQALKGRP